MLCSSSLVPLGNVEEDEGLDQGVQLTVECGDARDDQRGVFPNPRVTLLCLLLRRPVRLLAPLSYLSRGTPGDVDYGGSLVVPAGRVYGWARCGPSTIGHDPVP